MEPLAPRGVGPQTRQLTGLVGGDLEETSRGAIHDHGEQSAELVFDRGELADQWRAVHREPRAVDERQRDRLEQPRGAAGEDGDALGRREVARRAQIGLDALEVAPDFLGRRAVESEARQGLDHLAHPVLELDEVLAAAAIARLQLLVAGHHPVPARVHGPEPLDPLAFGGAVAPRPVRRIPARDSCHICPRARAGSRTACSRHARNPASRV